MYLNLASLTVLSRFCSRWYPSLFFLSSRYLSCTLPLSRFRLLSVAIVSRIFTSRCRHIARAQPIRSPIPRISASFASTDLGLVCSNVTPHRPIRILHALPLSRKRFKALSHGVVVVACNFLYGETFRCRVIHLVWEKKEDSTEKVKKG